MESHEHPTGKSADHLISLLRKLPLQRPPNDLVESVMKRIPTRRPSLTQRLLQSINRPVKLHLRPLYVMSLAMLLAGSFWLGRLSSPGTIASPSAERTPHLEALIPAGNAEAAFLFGWSLLAAERPGDGLTLLQKAAILAPDNPVYALGEGIAHWYNDHREQEENSYLRGLKNNPDYVPLHMNLGHYYLNNGRFAEALDRYQTVLTMAPDEAEAWYNSGLIYRHLGEQQDEVEAWKQYLEKIRTGQKAFRAVERLNNHGDFSYRIYQIGARQVVLKQSLLIDEKRSLSEKQQEMTVLSELLSHNSSLTLEVVSFAEHDSQRARRIALEIKQLIVETAGKPVADRIAISWFDSVEPHRQSTLCKTEGTASLLFFGVVAPPSQTREI